MKRKIVGITSTVPIEVIYASQKVPLDLNNLFFSDTNRGELVKEGEVKGLNGSFCGWLKGIFGVTFRQKIKEVVFVGEGDCSGSRLLAEFLRKSGIKTYEFSYPIDGARHLLEEEILRFCDYFKVKLEDVRKKFVEFKKIREKLIEIDKLTYEKNIVSGFENFIYLISGSDMDGNPDLFLKKIEKFLEDVKERNKNFLDKLRVGFIGVPTLITNFFEVVEVLGGQIVFNETARQFSLSFESMDIFDAYLEYTYPYHIEKRIEDIKREVEKRNIDCLIHNVQSFCFHSFEDEIFKTSLGVPILKIESNIPSKMSERDILRLENFFNSVKKVPGTKIKKVPGTKIGFDLGSRWVKVVGMKNDEIFFEKIIDTVKFYKKYCLRESDGVKLNFKKFLDDFFDEGIDLSQIYFGATGYGKGVLSKIKNGKTVPEIIAHVRGAIFLSGETNFTLLDIGGQDTKVAKVENGELVDFKMNDKCAAGSGRYIENIARILDISVDEFGKFFDKGVYISSICATFGESEVISRIAEGYSIEEICSGVNRAVVRRVLPDLVRFKSDLLIITGGISKNLAIVKLIEEEGVFKKILTFPKSEFCGAIGTIV